MHTWTFAPPPQIAGMYVSLVGRVLRTWAPPLNSLTRSSAGYYFEATRPTRPQFLALEGENPFVPLHWRGAAVLYRRYRGGLPSVRASMLYLARETPP